MSIPVSSFSFSELQMFNDYTLFVFLIFFPHCFSSSNCHKCQTMHINWPHKYIYMHLTENKQEVSTVEHMSHKLKKGYHCDNSYSNWTASKWAVNKSVSIRHRDNTNCCQQDLFNLNLPFRKQKELPLHKTHQDPQSEHIKSKTVITALWTKQTSMHINTLNRYTHINYYR